MPVSYTHLDVYKRQGLLAVFTIMRFRSINIPVREMTYLYLAIMLPFANALFVATRVPFTDVLVINGVLALFVVVLDRGLSLIHI